jgi:hypothetical protein
MKVNLFDGWEYGAAPHGLEIELESALEAKEFLCNRKIITMLDSLSIAEQQLVGLALELPPVSLS